MHFSVLTYNIHSGLDAHDKYSLEAIIAVLKASGAEVICLQEVNKNWGEKSGWDDQVSILSEALGMHAVFSPSISIDSKQPGAGKSEFGNLLLSNFPVKNHKIYNFYINNDPKLKYDGTHLTEPRSALVSELDLQGDSIWILLTHMAFDLPIDNSDQILKIQSIIKGIEGKLILAGDLNCLPDSNEMRILRRELNDASEDKKFITMPEIGGQIDYVLTRGIKVEEIKVVASSASDHFPLLAKITLG